jgi:hypothetical protein
MPAPANYAPAMRRKRLTLLLLVVAISVVALLIYEELLGRWGIAIGWIALIAGAVIANMTLTCPGCGKKLGGLFQTACAQCGVLLTDKVIILPAQQGAIDPVAAEYMATSRRILARWDSTRRLLRWGVPLAGVAGWIFMVVMMKNDEWPSRIGLGVFVGAVCASVAWLILHHLADNLFGVGFMLFRGRCPLCRAWFTAPTTVVLGATETDYSLPKFCGACGAKLA